MRQCKQSFPVGVLLAAIGAAWLVYAWATNPVGAENAEIGVGKAAGILDGMTFASELGPLGKPANVKDSLVFANGTFVSKECERRCGYPARPYFVRRVINKTEFISETRCPGKDATIVWRGTVDEADGTIKGKFTWTVERWYWTIKKEFWFRGRLANADVPLAGDASVPVASER